MTPDPVEQRTARLAMLALAGLAVSIFWSTATVEIVSVLIILAAGGITLSPEKRGVDKPGSEPAFWLWTGFVVAIALSAFVADDHAPWHEALRARWHVLLFPALIIAAPSLRDRGLAAACFVISGTAASVLLLVLQIVSGLEAIEHSRWESTTLADLIALSGVVTAALATLPTRYRNGLILVVVLHVTALAGRALRAPLVAIIAGIVATVWLLKPRYVLHTIAAMILLLLAVSGEILVLKFQWILSGQPVDRYALWARAWDLWRSLPVFGFGFDSFAVLSTTPFPVVLSASPPSSWHNDVIQTFFECGWFAGIFHVGLLAAVVRRGISRMRAATGPARMESTTLLIILAQLILCAMVGLVASTAVLGAVWWTVLALVHGGFEKESAVPV